MEHRKFLKFDELESVENSFGSAFFGSAPLDCSVVKWEVENLNQKANKRWINPLEQVYNWLFALSHPKHRM